ncbi:phosphotransferase enzyme family protein [Oceanirhabdus sp. W0125-5]|uniref:phosphotransferase enzyme family protein n=1 Tax=Oceanirhabdus sp. W0125-5 TaxID=2999116 RepID=UPI0022F2DE6C|nr:phosphotransferase [Oceanirhabdus sp. W0125-5]WBW97260.1 phosphotransferase [Oceanirhabdus sp. W0125-5]
MEKHIKELFTDKVLEECALSFGLTLSDVTYIGGFENFVYEFKRNSKEYILRIGHSDHREYDMIRAELDWVNFLAKNKANVSIPIESNGGNLVEIVKVSDGSYFTVTGYEKAKGSRPTKEIINDDFCFEYGRAVGKLHNLTKKYKVTDGIPKRYEWHEDILFKNGTSFLPEEDEFIIEKYNELITYLKGLPTDVDSYGLIHTDIHFGNFFVEKNKITIFDFDDCSYKWYISDIAIVIFYLTAFSMDSDTRNSFIKEFLPSFMKGYNVENKLDDFWLKELMNFIKLREFTIYIVIHRSFDVNNLPEWAEKFKIDFKRRLEKNIPLMNLDFI